MVIVGKTCVTLTGIVLMARISMHELAVHGTRVCSESTKEGLFRGVPTTVTYSGYNCNKDDRLWGEDLTAAAANSMMTEKIRRSNTVRNLSWTQVVKYYPKFLSITIHRQKFIIKSRC